MEFLHQIMHKLERRKAMKEKYIKPDVDVETFATVDVITTSGSDGGDGPIELPDFPVG